MKNKKYELNMTQGSIFKNIIIFVIPLVIGNLLQVLYNAADLVVVSRFAGSNAMASVGATGTFSGLIVNFCIGFAVGASVVVSRRFGADDKVGVSDSVHTAMLLSLILGVAAMAIGLFSSRFMLELMGTPEGVVLEGAVTYMKIYFLGVPGAMIYNFGASILRAVGDTKRPLYILSLSGLLNVVLNVVFVVGFGMDVDGVAAATSIANYSSAAAVVWLLVKSDSICKLDIRKLKIHKMELRETVKIGLPAGFQSSMFSISNMVIQSAVNSFGEAAIAGNAAVGNIESFIYVAMNSISQATVTGVSQNAGARKNDRVKRTFFITAAVVTVIGLVLGGICTLLAKPLLDIYITDSVQALSFGLVRVGCVWMLYFLCGLMDVFSGALRGMGYSFMPMINSLLGACAFRVLWMTVFLPLKRTPVMLFLCWPASWVLVILLHLVYMLFIRKGFEQKMGIY